MFYLWFEVVCHRYILTFDQFSSLKFLCCCENVQIICFENLNDHDSNNNGGENSFFNDDPLNTTVIERFSTQCKQNELNERIIKREIVSLKTLESKEFYYKCVVQRTQNKIESRPNRIQMTWLESLDTQSLQIKANIPAEYGVGETKK